MARRVNKELEKLKHIEYHIDDIVNDDTVSELIHYFAMKHGRKLLATNHGTEKVEINFKRLDEALKYLGDTHGIHDRRKFYLTMQKSISDNFTQEQDDIMFFERLINSNNRAKGIYTEDILEYAFKPHPTEYFLEFLKLMCFTYRKNGFNKTLLELYDKHIGDYSEIINDPDDIIWLRDYKHQKRLYDFLAKGGTIYQKGNSIDCFKSFFYGRTLVPEELARISNDKNWEEDFSIKPMLLSIDTVKNLIKFGFINKKHLNIEIKFLLDRNFYIPKKKRRKRIYTEDRQYIIVRDSDIELKEKRYTFGKYNAGTPKIVRDKKSYKKRYIPAVKNEKWVEVYYIDILRESKEEYYNCVKMINDINA